MAGEFNATQAAQLLTTYISRKFIPALERDLQLQKFTTKVIVPPGMGKVGRVVTFSSPPGTTTPVTAGSVSNAVDITTTGTNVTIAEFGEYMHLESLQEYASAPTMRAEVTDRFTHGALICIDSLVRTQHQLNTTNIYIFTATSAGSAAIPAGTPTAANAAGIISARKKLKDAYAVGFRGISGHPEGQYAAVISQQAEVDIVTEATTGRMTWAQAVTNVPGALGQTKWVNGYIGSIYGVAVYTSQNLSTGQSYSSANISVNFVIADGAIAAMAFEDMNPNIYINTPGAGSTDNPYRNFASIAWHINFGTGLNDATRAVKLYSLGS